MSRTKKGSKPIGYELQSRRPCRYIDPSPHAKRDTHRAERRDNKALIARISEEYKDVLDGLAKS